MNVKKRNFKWSHVVLAMVLLAIVAFGIFAYNNYAKERERIETENERILEEADSSATISVLNNEYRPDSGNLTVHLQGEKKELPFAQSAKNQITIDSFETLAKSIVAKGDLTVRLFAEEELLFEGNAEELGKQKGLDGNYRLELSNIFPVAAGAATAPQEKPQDIEGELVYNFNILYDPPLEFLTEVQEGDEYLQGDMLKLDAQGISGAVIETNLPSEIKFYENENQYTAIIPFGYTLKTQEYYVKASKGTESKTFSFQVGERKFVQQHITVSAETSDATVNSAAANKEFSDVMNAAKAITDEELYITAPFIAPLTGRISTEFGMQRFVNNSKNPSRHSGIDIAGNKIGTPIVAANRGRVIVSQFLMLTGNTVVIEHGFGLKSIYYHMDSLTAQKGAMIEQGDEVGKVGTTGFSTGPHLHFSMCVNSVWIKPLYDYES